MSDKTLVRLFIASPSDVATERDLVEDVVAEINRINSKHHLETLRWEKDTFSDVGDGPAQDVIERQLEIGQCDVFVLIMWHRAGSDAGDGRPGTIREFDGAIRARERQGKPHIMAFFSEKPVRPSAVDSDQLRQLTAFKERVAPTGLVSTYAGPADFEGRFREQLSLLLATLPAPGQEPPASDAEEGADEAVDLAGEITAFRASIDEAMERISPYILETPVIQSKRLGREFGCKIYLKLENLQSTGSFKIRGAMNAVLIAEAEKTTFVTASAGNHGLGLAYSAHRHKHSSRIFMPATTPLTKIKAIERYTSDIDTESESFEVAKERALAYARDNDLPFVHPYDDLDVAAGQGTVGLELVRQFTEERLEAKPPDYVIIPVGGGGLITGVATVLREAWPEARIIGVEPEVLKSFSEARLARMPVLVPGRKTFAEGIAVAEMGQRVFPLANELVDEIWSVSDESMAKAVVQLIEDSRIMAEGAGACPLGALIERAPLDPAAIKGRRVLLLVSGGNLDITALASLLERGLHFKWRLTRYRFPLSDRPGSLARLTQDISDKNVNIVDIEHSRLSKELQLGSAQVDVLVETRDQNHAVALLTDFKKNHPRASIVTS